jgi:hypothetical protein
LEQRGRTEEKRMYQFSRSIYRELSPVVVRERAGDAERNREALLRACERAFERLARDRHYFARPARSLFNEVRVYMPMSMQLHAYEVVERHMKLAIEYVDQHARAGVTFDGSPLCCHATTRKGTPCQRVPLPGSKYCPSHQHLEEELELTTAAA